MGFNILPSRPFAFLAVIDVLESIINLELIPLSCEDYSLEESIISGLEVYVDGDGRFTRDLGVVQIPGLANCVSGGLIEAEIILEGLVITEDSFCGDLTGMLHLPWQSDFADLNFDPMGTTFAARRIDEYGEYVNLNDRLLPKSCADL